MAPTMKPSKQVKRKTPAKAKEPTAAAKPKPPAKTIAYDEDGVDTLFEAMSIVAVRCDDDGDRFWIAQLLDDTIEDMLDDEAAQVNVVYFEKVVSDKPTNLYRLGNYDAIPVQAIMCEIQLDEPSPGDFKLPKRHLERIESILAKVDAGEEVPEEMLQPLKKRKTNVAFAEVTTKRETKSKTSKTAAVKLDKLSGLPKKIGTVPHAASFTDDAMSGKHAFRSKCSDVESSSKEIIRAVLVKDHKLLENLVKKPELHKHMHSFFTTRSVGVPKTALHYAIERADLKAIKTLISAAKDDKVKLAKKPVCALVTLDTGKHTSSFSDYNRRALNASRGGKEGNNALLKDQGGRDAAPITKHGIDQKLEQFLWENPSTTYEMIMLFYPGDDWVRGSFGYIPLLARAGNHALLQKLVAILVARGGWGYNNLHGQVLGSEPLEPFKKVSVLKKAGQHSIRPLHFAALNPSPGHLETLLGEVDQAGLAEVDAGNWTAVHYAAACQGSGPLKVLLKAGVDVSLRTKSKDTPLTIAAKLGRLDNVKLLLEHSATDVSGALETAAWLGFRPLHYAAQNGHDQVVKFLLAKGANANAGTSGKESPLALAAEAGHLSCVNALLQHKGIAVDILNKVRRTPLMMAVMNGHVQVAVALLNAGANANAVDTSMNTVMHYAAGYGWLSCVKLLEGIEAAAWFRNAWGYSPMAVAALKGRYDVSRYLIAKAPANEHAVDFRDANGATMLFLQCKLAESTDEIEFLLKNGASPNVPTSTFEYPLQQVLRRLPDKDLEPVLVSMVNLLVQHKAHITHDDMRHVGQPLALAMAKKDRRFFDQFLPDSDLSALGPKGQNLWMEAVAHDPEYLTAMLAVPKAKFTIVQDTDGNNWFHSVVYAPSATHSIETIQAVVKRLTKDEVAAAMASVNNDGLTPLMALVHHERPTKDKVDYSQQDHRYGALLRLYLQHTPNVESLVKLGKVDPTDPAKRLDSSSETLLHLAAGRQLSPAKGWQGDDVLQVIVEHGKKWTKAVVNAVTSFKKTALLLASENGHALGAQALLKKHADPNFYLPDKENNIEGVTPLFAAVSNGHAKIAGFLLEHGAKPSFAEGKGLKTPLHVALERNDADVADVLLAHNADVCALNEAGLSALSSAILQGFSVTKDELHANEVHFGLAYNAFAEDGWDFLCIEDRSKVREEVAVAANIAKTIHKEAAAPTNDDDDGSEDNEGDDDDDDEGDDDDDDEDNEDNEEEKADEVAPAEDQPVEPLAASSSPKRSAISVLLQHANAAPAIGLGDDRGRTPLHYACAKRDVHLLRALLLLSKAAVNAEDTHKRTPLHFAVNAAVMTPDATFDVESVLLLHGANVNAVDTFGFSALHFAFLKVNLDWQTENPKATADDFKEYLRTVPATATDPIETVGNLCLVQGIQVDRQDVLGRTSLHLGAATGAVVSTLSILHVAPKSLLEVADDKGDTALGRAMANGRKDVVTNLIQQGANIQVQFTKDNAKISLYYYAVENKWQGVCHMLLNAGYCRRQAVEDSIRSNGFQLTQNLIAGLLNTKDKTLTRTNDDGQTLLHVLAQQPVEFDGIVRTIAWQLVDAGVSVSATTAKGETALHFAAVHGSLNLMRFLLHLDSTLTNKLTKAKESPVVYALKHAKAGKKGVSEESPSFTPVVRSLVYLGRNGTNLAHADTEGQTVLTLLLDRFFVPPTSVQWQLQLLDLVDFLLSTCGVSPNGQYKTRAPFGCSPQTSDPVLSVTPLIRGVYIPSVFLREHTLAMLLHHGAKIQDTDSQGNTALMHAIVRNQLDDVRILLGGLTHAERPTTPLHNDASADKLSKTWTIKVSAQDKVAALKVSNVYGETALHLAVQPRAHGSFENVAIVELLLKEKVPLKALDKRKKSAIDLAKEQQSGILLRVLTNGSSAPANKVKPVAFADVPPVDHDATVYLNQCQAQGLVKTVHIALTKCSNCEAGPKASVHVDGAIEYSVVLTKVDVQAGQHGVNVFYRMQVVHNQVQDVYVLFTNWGRIGESGKYQHTPFNDAASAVDEFKKIFKSKTGNAFDRVFGENGGEFEKKAGKYMLNPRRRERHEYDGKVTEPFTSQATSVPSALDAGVQQVLGVVTDIRCLEQAASSYHHNLTDIPLVELQPSLLVTALDRLTEIKTSLQENAAVLKRMSATDVPLEPAAIAALADAWRAASEAIAEKSSRYYELVPRSDATSETALAAFMSEDDVNKEITRVRQLLEIAETSKIILGAKSTMTRRHPLDYCYDALQVHLAPSSGVELDMISQYFASGFQTETKAYKVSRVFKVHRKGEPERMQSLTVPGHHTLLWHGTRKTNLMGILSRGLRIAPPEAPVTGYAFGKGIYFADSSEKSLNYCGGDPYKLSDKRDVHYMLLCDVALGNLHKVVESEYREAAAEGTHSTFAMAKFQPNPSDTLVTSIGACQIPLGKMQEIGVDTAFSSAWAIGSAPDMSSTRVATYRMQNGTLDRAGEVLLDKALATRQTRVEWEQSSELSVKPLHIFGDRWGSPSKVIVEVKDKLFHVNGRDRVVACTVTVEFENNPKYSYAAHKYYDVFPNEQLPKGFKFHKSAPYLNHNEYIVYNEAQARIAYLVEIEVTGLR